MSQTMTADDGSELRISEDVSDKARIEAERVFEAVSCNVTVQSSDFQDRNKIAVFWNEDDDMMSYKKANIINAVFQSPASVELVTTRDDETAVQFVAQ